MNESHELKPIVHLLAGDLWGGKEAQLLTQLSSGGQGRRPSYVLMFNEGRVSERFREKNIAVDIEPETKNFFALYLACRARLRERAPGVLVAHGYKEILIACLCARSLRIPFIPVFHGRAEPHPGFAGVKLSFYEYLALFVARNFASAIVCVSRALSKDLGLYGMTKLRVIYNTHTRSGTPSASTSETFQKKPAMYMIGRLVRVKRIDVAIDALQGLISSGNETLYIAGDGPEEKMLREKVARLGLSERVEFLGFREDATDLIRECDGFVISSDSEGVPTVLLDAIWYGVPIVSTAVGGIPEVMHMFPGYPVRLVPPGNRVELMRAMEDCRREGIKDAANSSRFEILQSLFSPESAQAQYETVYLEAMGAHVG